MGTPKYFSTVAVRDGHAWEVWHHVRSTSASEQAAVLEMQSAYPALAILVDHQAATLKGARIRPELTNSIKRKTTGRK